jgi:hypothetical protein
MYELKMRLKHLFGRPLSGKYGLPAERPSDRHRWFFSLDESREFCRVNATRNGWVLECEGYVVGPRRQGFLSRRIVDRWPNLLAETYVALLAAPQAT